MCLAIEKLVSFVNKAEQSPPPNRKKTEHFLDCHARLPIADWSIRQSDSPPSTCSTYLGVYEVINSI
jgi:hypothetical protein